MTTALRSKENDCDFPLFKTPLRTPMLTPARNRMISSATMNDIAYYSNHIKSLKFTGTTSMNDLQSCNDTIKTPIRLNKIKLSTPVSIQRRRALGLVNNNLNQAYQTLSTDEPVIAPTPSKTMTCSHPEDDLPHKPAKIDSYENTFDDLIPADERVERMLMNQTNGINLFAFHGGIENTIRCQSPHCSRIDVSSLLDILN